MQNGLVHTRINPLCNAKWACSYPNKPFLIKKNNALGKTLLYKKSNR